MCYFILVLHVYFFFLNNQAFYILPIKLFWQFSRDMITFCADVKD